MGVRAVTTVIELARGPVRRFYGHWASPEYQIPHLADFITWADRTRQPLTTASFHRYATDHPGTLPVEDVTDDFDDESAGDLDYRYHLTLADEARWLKLVVHDVRQSRVIHTVIGRPDLYATAARMCDQAAARGMDYARRIGDTLLPGGDPDDWQQAAADYRRLGQATAIRAMEANLHAQYTPAGPDEPHPSLMVGGVLVLAYLDDLATLHVSIDLDDTADWLLRPDGTVPIRVFVSGEEVYTAVTPPAAPEGQAS